jgi:hypothetical protein
MIAVLRDPKMGSLPDMAGTHQGPGGGARLSEPVATKTRRATIRRANRKCGCAPVDRLATVHRHDLAVTNNAGGRHVCQQAGRCPL